MVYGGVGGVCPEVRNSRCGPLHEVKPSDVDKYSSLAMLPQERSRLHEGAAYVEAPG